MAQIQPRRLLTAFVVVATMAVAVFGFPTDASEDLEHLSPDEFYRGRTITVISPAGPSSTFTLLARVIGPYLEKYTGANVEIVPMQAGAGVQASNYLAKAKPDGLTITLVGHGPKMITGDMFEAPGVRYDWSSFVPLGKIVESEFVVYGPAEAGWGPEDLRGRHIGFGESSAFFGPQFAEALGWDQVFIVSGYRSSSDRAVAVARGDIQATSGSIELYATQPDIVAPIVSALPIARAPEVPTISEVVLPGRERWADLIEDWMQVMYMAYAPAGISEERADFLSAALEATWADPGFAVDLEKLKITQSEVFISRADLRSTFDKLASLDAESVKELRIVVEAKYKKK